MVAPARWRHAIEHPVTGLEEPVLRANRAGRAGREIVNDAKGRAILGDSEDAAVEVGTAIIGRAVKQSVAALDERAIQLQPFSGSRKIVEHREAAAILVNPVNR